MRQSPIKTIATMAVTVLVCVSTACTTLRPVAIDPAGDEVRRVVRVGDTVRLLMRGGERHSLQITALGASALAGDAVATWRSGVDVSGTHVEVRYADIDTIDVQTVSGGRTAAVIAGVGLAVLIGVATGGGSHSPGYSR